MSSTDRITVRFSREQINALVKKSQEVGMTPPELVRLAVAAFLAKESSLTEYLEAVDVLDKKLAVLVARQEQFATMLGIAVMQRDVDKTDERRQALAERIKKITETIS